MAAAVQTIALNDYQILEFRDVIDQQFNTRDAFWRAIKVFLVSYAGYEGFAPEIYAEKLNQYMNAMRELFGVNPNMDYMAKLQNQLNGQQTTTNIMIKRVRGYHLVQNLRVVLRIDTSVSGQIPLAKNSELQIQNFTKKLSFEDLVVFKRDNREISFEIFGDDWWDFGGELNVFTIGFSEISAEGFEDWFYFGRGIEILIKIETQVHIEPGVVEEDVPHFHLHTLFHMLRHRFLQYNQQENHITGFHRYTAQKSKLSYIRQRVDPTSETAFWPNERTPENILNRIRAQLETGANYSGIGDILSKTVQYCDLQISHFVKDEEEYEDTVCLCSEWCNFNAFFYFNPIYRDLLVHHNQLYMKNKTNVADMYLFVSTSILHLAEQPDMALLPHKAPVLQLMNQANEYRKLNYLRYYMTKPKWRQAYNDSQPPYEDLLAMSHKILKESALIAETVIQSAIDPFADICCENLTNYYKVLSDLHLDISKIRFYVAYDNIRDWMKELDQMSREEYAVYIRTAYENKFIALVPGFDKIFTEDYDYSNVFVVDDNAREVKRMRDQIYKFNVIGGPQNPMNLRQTLNPLAATFVSIYKLLHTVDPMLPKAKTRNALYDVYEFCIAFDRDFTDFFMTNGFRFQSESNLWPQQTPEQLETVKRHYVFYTLKLYWMAFGLQKYCINSLLKYNKKASKDYRLQVCDHFDFIWNYAIIEDTFRNQYMELFFQIPVDISLYINAFYNVFWGPAEHELNVANVNFQGCIDSALFQYQRLYFWWRNNGDYRPKFQRIFDVFVQNQGTIALRTQQIYGYYIIRGILSIPEYERNIEVMDVLVYYLVRAICSMIINSIREFLMPLHQLQVDELLDENISYSLSKPGWVPIFRTMRSTLEHFDQIQQMFVFFEDENERILKTISETRRIIKNIYRQFYHKLLVEWDAEMFLLYSQRTNDENRTRLLSIHMVSGLSFLCAFINDFRKQGRYHLKNCETTLRMTTHQNLTHRMVFHSCLQGYEQYLNDPNAMAQAIPFFEVMWQPMLGQYFQEFDQMTAQDVGIDLQEADVAN